MSKEVNFSYFLEFSISRYPVWKIHFQCPPLKNYMPYFNLDAMIISLFPLFSSIIIINYSCDWYNLMRNLYVCKRWENKTNVIFKSR